MNNVLNSAEYCLQILNDYKHSTFPKLSLEAFETELEKCVIKAKWEKTRELRKNEEKHKDDESDEPKAQTTTVFDAEKCTIDFRNSKATDLNKG